MLSQMFDMLDEILLGESLLFYLLLSIGFYCKSANILTNRDTGCKKLIGIQIIAKSHLMTRIQVSKHHEMPDKLFLILSSPDLERVH